jgi:hypothetical protein
MTDDLPQGWIFGTDGPAKLVARDGKLFDYAVDYSKILHAFFPDTIPDTEFLDSDDAARYFAELVGAVLSASASASDHAALLSNLDAVRNNEDAELATDRIAHETPFASVAEKIREANHKHGPSWGAWLAGIVIPIVLPLSGILGSSAQPTSPPQPSAVVAIQTPISVVYGNANSGQSVRITGPPYDVEKIINILQNMSPTAWGQLSQSEQYSLALKIFFEMHKGQHIDITYPQLKFSGGEF